MWIINCIVVCITRPLLSVIPNRILCHIRIVIVNCCIKEFFNN